MFHLTARERPLPKQFDTNDDAKQKRENTRQVFFKAWYKKQKGQALEALEKQVATLIEQHPEYHSFFADEKNIDHDFSSEKQVVNPFLHLGMHLAIADQLALQQPAGIRELYQRLAQHYSDVHEAEHQIMNCLAYWMQQPQTQGETLDYSPYMQCLQKLLENN